MASKQHPRPGPDDGPQRRVPAAEAEQNAPPAVQQDQNRPEVMAPGADGARRSDRTARITARITDWASI